MKLVIEIRNRQPIELVEFAQGMLSVGGEYDEYLAQHSPYLDADEARIYVKEVRSGSVITELVALAPYALPLIEHADSILEYGKHLIRAYEWLLGRAPKEGRELSKKSLQYLSNIEPPPNLWRLQHLREWSHEEIKQVFP